MKKLEGVIQSGQAKMLAKKSHNVGNFSGSYSKGRGQQAYLAHPIRSALTTSIMVPTKVFSQ